MKMTLKAALCAAAVPLALLIITGTPLPINSVKL